MSAVDLYLLTLHALAGVGAWSLIRYWLIRRAFRRKRESERTAWRELVTGDREADAIEADRRRTRLRERERLTAPAVEARRNQEQNAKKGRAR